MLELADVGAPAQVTPVIDRTYQLTQAAEAIRPGTRGKVVMTL